MRTRASVSKRFSRSKGHSRSSAEHPEEKETRARPDDWKRTPRSHQRRAKMSSAPIGGRKHSDSHSETRQPKKAREKPPLSSAQVRHFTASNLWRYIIGKHKASLQKYELRLLHTIKYILTRDLPTRTHYLYLNCYRNQTVI